MKVFGRASFQIRMPAAVSIRAVESPRKTDRIEAKLGDDYVDPLGGLAVKRWDEFEQGDGVAADSIVEPSPRMRPGCAERLESCIDALTFKGWQRHGETKRISGLVSEREASRGRGGGCG